MTVTVLDALGRERGRLMDNEICSAGAHTLRFDAHGLRPGMYFVRLVAGEEVRQQKVVLLRY